MPRPVNGFTLIEALVVMTVAAILLAVAIPAWSHAKAAANAGSVRADLAASLLDAVRHSAIAGSEVVVCPVTAPRTMQRFDQLGWWLAGICRHQWRPDPGANETLLAEARRCRRESTCAHRGSHAAGFPAEWRKRGIERDFHPVRLQGIGQRDDTGPIQFREISRRQADGERRLGLRLREMSRVPPCRQTQKTRLSAGFLLESGARSWTRTNDPLINSQVL